MINGTQLTWESNKTGVGGANGTKVGGYLFYYPDEETNPGADFRVICPKHMDQYKRQVEEGLADGHSEDGEGDWEWKPADGGRLARAATAHVGR